MSKLCKFEICLKQIIDSDVNSDSPKNPDPSKVPILRIRTRAIQVQTPPLGILSFFLLLPKNVLQSLPSVYSNKSDPSAVGGLQKLDPIHDPRKGSLTGSTSRIGCSRPGFRSGRETVVS